MTMIRTFVSAATLLLAVGATGALAADGAQVYKDHCMKCHGETGHADTPAGKSLKTPPFVGDAKVAAAPVTDLVKSVKENEKHAKAGILKGMSDADIEAAAAHAKELAGAK